ncbi:MAG: hypothetical protein JNJ46_20020 [Myxococcales bacterium]|nr:hypothetical protein [Myxococcales bacterium]
MQSVVRIAFSPQAIVPPPRGFRACALGMLLWLLSAGAAQSSPTDPGPAVRSVQQAELRLRDAAAASEIVSLLAEAQRLAAFPGLYLQLGSAAENAGRFVVAADFYNRYLHSVNQAGGQGADPAGRIPEFVRQLREPHVEVDLSGGQPGQYLFVNGRFTGVLPLPTPILLPAAAGELHVMLVGSERVMASERTRLPDGSRQLHAELSSRGDLLNLSLSRPLEATVSVVFSEVTAPGLRAEVLTALDSALHESHIQRRGQSPPRQSREAVAEPAPLCLPPLLPTDRHRPLSDIASLARISLVPLPAPASGYVGMVHIYDLNQGALLPPEIAERVSGEPANPKRVVCSSCSGAQAATAIAKATAGLLRAVNDLQVVELSVLSQPVDAQVYVDGCLRYAAYGSSLRVYAGRTLTESVTRRVEVRKRGYRSSGEIPVVLSGANRQHTLPDPTQSATENPFVLRRTARPAWRLLLGAGLAAAGGTMIGFGIGALVRDGNCIDTIPHPMCVTSYQTLPLGLGLVIPGAATLAAGVVTMAWPVR